MPRTPHPWSPAPKHHPTGTPNLNAIAPIQPPDSAATRIADRLRVCQRLVEIGLELAEIALRKARREEAAQDPQSQPEDPPHDQKSSNATLDFARASRAVRQTLALEARFDQDQQSATKHANRPAPDPRRASIRYGIHDATQNHPDRAEIRRDADERLELDLAADPDGNTQAADLFHSIGEELGIEVDYATLPDLLLGDYPTTTPLPANYIDALFNPPPNAPPHHATDPPPPP